MSNFKWLQTSVAKKLGTEVVDDVDGERKEVKVDEEIVMQTEAEVEVMV